MPSSLIELINYYEEFKDLYFEIINDFGFDHEKDRKARDVLLEMIQKKVKNTAYSLESVLLGFKEAIRSRKNVVIYGCGPSLEDTVEIVLEKYGIEIFQNSINLAADGATLFLREKKIPITAIFSDLDGITRNEFSHSDYMVIHGHGDNINRLEYFRDRILGFHNVIGTTQVEPLGAIINPGGFTDGDRILFFLRTLAIPRNILYLIGMDFKSAIGKYSKPEMNNNQEGSPIKQKKLGHAIKLLEWLHPRLPSEMYFVNTNRISNKFNYVSIEEFVNMVLDKR
jgi:uncharacterized Rossmann fold enzyme